MLPCKYQKPVYRTCIFFYQVDQLLQRTCNFTAEKETEFQGKSHGNGFFHIPGKYFLPILLIEVQIDPVMPETNSANQFGIFFTEGTCLARFAYSQRRKCNQ